MAQHIHAVIISWLGKHDQARAIAAALGPAIARLSIIASHPEAVPPAGPGIWRFLPDEQFFGPKFAAALADTRPDEILLLIHADTEFDDWPALVQHCHQAFDTVAGLAVWAPDFTWTPYDTASVALPADPALPGGLIPVAQTDGIIAAFSPAVQQRLSELDCAGNNLGWGIDWAALGWAFSHGQPVLRDTRLVVTHRKGRSYGSAEARAQMSRFLGTLTPAERIQIRLLHSYIRRQSALRRSRLNRIWRLLRGRQDATVI